MSKFNIRIFTTAHMWIDTVIEGENFTQALTSCLSTKGHFIGDDMVVMVDHIVAIVREEGGPKQTKVTPAGMH